MRNFVYLIIFPTLKSCKLKKLCTYSANDHALQNFSLSAFCPLVKRFQTGKIINIFFGNLDTQQQVISAEKC